MFCPRCHTPLRWDETLANLHTPDCGIILACPTCHAAAEGVAYAVRMYPAGQPVPRHPMMQGADLPICGLCRRALLIGEQTTSLRVPVNHRGVSTGVYDCCGECVEEWQPAVAERLRIETGVLYEPATLNGDMLL